MDFIRYPTQISINNFFTWVGYLLGEPSVDIYNEWVDNRVLLFRKWVLTNITFYKTRNFLTDEKFYVRKRV